MPGRDGSGPPGIGCPVISCLSGADLALLVTEPPVSGARDLDRIARVCRRFGIPAAVCINKYDINPDNARQAEVYCREQGLDIAARLPYDEAMTEAMILGRPVVEYGDTPLGRQIRQRTPPLWPEAKEKAMPSHHCDRCPRGTSPL